MDEYGWLHGADVRKLLAHLGADPGARKVRLLACAFVRRVWDLLEHPAFHAAVETSERAAGYRAGKTELRAAGAAIDAAVEDARLGVLHDKDVLPEYFHHDYDELEWHARWHLQRTTASLPLVQVAQLVRPLVAKTISPAVLPLIADNARRLLGYHLDEPVQCDLVREVFGNPFRPSAFSSDWRTDTAVSLAEHIREKRDFSAMPILADALQDAGCDDSTILTHCRDANAMHVRGCWAVDLVLGQE